MILAAAAIALQMAVRNVDANGAPAMAWYPEAKGKYPLIAISHGHGGLRFTHHDLGEALAKAGFVAVAVDHAGDSLTDVRNPISGTVLSNRPKQISTLIDAVLRDAVLGPRVDPERIAVAGFSAGGYTALVLAGARPSEELWREFCRTHADEKQVCPASEPLEGHADPRIRAAYAMAPIGFLFDRQHLRDVHVPVRIVAGASDMILPVAENAERVARDLPSPVKVWEIAGAGHYIFIPPCDLDARARFPDLCLDRRGIDRAAIHEKLNGDIIGFFQRVLR